MQPGIFDPRCRRRLLRDLLYGSGAVQAGRTTFTPVVFVGATPFSRLSVGARDARGCIGSMSAFRPACARAADRATLGQPAAQQYGSDYGALMFSWLFSDPLPVGTHAPDFSLPDDSGRLVTLSALRGKIVVLVFYPGDDTPG